MSLLLLFIKFFKIGLFAVGGGLATIPFLKQLSVETNWFTLNQLADMIAISESTPGPIGINMASYVGYITFGVIGEVIATIGIITPSIIIILLISKFLKKFKENKYIANAFYAMRPCSTALIASAVISLVPVVFFKNANILQVTNVKIYSVFLFICLMYFINKYNKIHPAFYIMISAIIGIIFKL